MKKKLLLMVFVLAAFIFVGAVNVNAETYTVTTSGELEEHLFDSEGIEEETTIKLGASMSTNSINENDELGVYVKSNLTIDLNGKTLTTDSRIIFFSYYEGYTVSIVDTSAEKTGKIIVPGNGYNGFLLQMIDDSNWDGTSKLILSDIYVENINSGNLFYIDNSGDQYNKFEIKVKNSVVINAGEIIGYSIPNNNFRLIIEPTTTFLANATTSEIFVTDSIYYYSQYVNASEAKVRVKDTSTSAESELNLNTTEMCESYYSIRIVPKDAEFYNVTISSTTNGTVTGTALTDVLNGENRLLTIAPESGYMLDTVLVNGVDKTTDVVNNQLTLNVDENKNVVVTFKLITYDVTISPTTNGNVTGTSLAGVPSGENRTLAITPNANYMIDKVLVNSVDKTNEVVDNQLNLTVGENKIVSVTFKKIPCKLTINNITGATITPNGIINIGSGDNQDVVITAAPGYKLKSVKVNNVEKIDTLKDNKLELTNITEDTEIAVAVEKIVYSFLEGNDLKTSDLTKFTFRIDADYLKFSDGGKVFVDDVELNSTQYTSKSGSTIITLAKSFVSTLSKALHKIKIVFNDGAEVTTNFTIEQATISTPIDNPQTGDNILMYSIVFAISLLGITAFIVVDKKSKKNNNI